MQRTEIKIIVDALNYLFDDGPLSVKNL